MTRVAHLRARVIGAEIDSVLLDIDLPALREARKELPPGALKGYVCASADRQQLAIPLTHLEAAARRRRGLPVRSTIAW
jgi:hypothetical protein